MLWHRRCAVWRSKRTSYWGSSELLADLSTHTATTTESLGNFLPSGRWSQTTICYSMGQRNFPYKWDVLISGVKLHARTAFEGGKGAPLIRGSNFRERVLESLCCKGHWSWQAREINRFVALWKWSAIHIGRTSRPQIAGTSPFTITLRSQESSL